MDIPSDRGWRLLRMDFCVVRVRKCPTPMERRTSFPFFVIRMRSVTDLLVAIGFSLK